MAIYDADGNQLLVCYDADGSQLSHAYDADGSVIYSAITINLKVMEYNVGQWYIGSGVNVPLAKDAEYYALQNGMIANDDADILCLCEYRTQFSSNRTAKSMLEQYYPYIAENNGTAGYNGKCICSKYPISDYQSYFYTMDAGRKNNYDVVTVTVDDIPIKVICTHLEPTNQTVKHAQALELFNFAQSLNSRYIICADFNTEMVNPMSSDNNAVYGNFLNAGDTLANGGAFGIFNTSCNSDDWTNDANSIDNIICSPSIEITSVSTDTTKVTDSIMEGKIDHIPLIAEVSVL